MITPEEPSSYQQENKESINSVAPGTIDSEPMHPSQFKEELLP
jgi:hypothetical protein